jgi:hypothetical protein
VDDSVRHEVFTRRGGMYFGIAHLLDYPAATTGRSIACRLQRRPLRQPQRALQNAISVASGIPLVLDGDLGAHGADADAPPGNTETAARVLAADASRMSESAIRATWSKATARRSSAPAVPSASSRWLTTRGPARAARGGADHRAAQPEDHSASSRRPGSRTGSTSATGACLARAGSP